VGREVRVCGRANDRLWRGARCCGRTNRLTFKTHRFTSAHLDPGSPLRAVRAEPDRRDPTEASIRCVRSSASSAPTRCPRRARADHPERLRRRDPGDHPTGPDGRAAGRLALTWPTRRLANPPTPACCPISPPTRMPPHPAAVAHRAPSRRGLRTRRVSASASYPSQSLDHHDRAVRRLPARGSGAGVPETVRLGLIWVLPGGDSGARAATTSGGADEVLAASAGRPGAHRAGAASS